MHTMQPTQGTHHRQGQVMDTPDSEGTRRLKNYWAHGEGAAKIEWGVPGDFDRCVTLIQAAASKHGPPLPDRMIKGLCANLHHDATGEWPGHAAGEQSEHRR